MASDEVDTEPYNHAIGETYLGKYILVGVTVLNNEGEEIRRTQMHGIIEHVGPDGIGIMLRGKYEGHSWVMPPDLRSISEARPGVYTLHDTSEKVENPDLLASWTITEGPSSDGAP